MALYDFDIEGRRSLTKEGAALKNLAPGVLTGRGFQNYKPGQQMDRVQNPLRGLNNLKTLQEKDFKIQTSTNQFVQRSFKIEKTYFTEATKYITEDRRRTIARKNMDYKGWDTESKYFKKHATHMTKTESHQKQLLAIVTANSRVMAKMEKETRALVRAQHLQSGMRALGTFGTLMRGLGLITGGKTGVPEIVRALKKATAQPGQRGEFGSGVRAYMRGASAQTAREAAMWGHHLKQGPSSKQVYDQHGNMQWIIGHKNIERYNKDQMLQQRALLKEKISQSGVGPLGAGNMFQSRYIKETRREEKRDLEAMETLRKRRMTMDDIDAYTSRGGTIREMAHDRTQDRRSVGRKIAQGARAIVTAPLHPITSVRGVVKGAQAIGRGASAVGRGIGRVGGFVGKAAPVAVAGAEAVLAASAAKKGDYFGAATGIAAAIASVIPGLGPMVAIALSSISSLIPDKMKEDFNKWAPKIFSQMFGNMGKGGGFLGKIGNTMAEMGDGLKYLWKTIKDTLFHPTAIKVYKAIAELLISSASLLIKGVIGFVNFFKDIFSGKKSFTEAFIDAVKPVVKELITGFVPAAAKLVLGVAEILYKMAKAALASLMPKWLGETLGLRDMPKQSELLEGKKKDLLKQQAGEKNSANKEKINKELVDVEEKLLLVRKAEKEQKEREARALERQVKKETATERTTPETPAEKKKREDDEKKDEAQRISDEAAQKRDQAAGLIAKDKAAKTGYDAGDYAMAGGAGVSAGYAWRLIKGRWTKVPVSTTSAVPITTTGVPSIEPHLTTGGGGAPTASKLLDPYGRPISQATIDAAKVEQEVAKQATKSGWVKSLFQKMFSAEKMAALDKGVVQAAEEAGGKAPSIMPKLASLWSTITEFGSKINPLSVEKFGALETGAKAAAATTGPAQGALTAAQAAAVEAGQAAKTGLISRALSSGPMQGVAGALGGPTGQLASKVIGKALGPAVGLAVATYQWQHGDEEAALYTLIDTGVAGIGAAAGGALAGPYGAIAGAYAATLLRKGFTAIGDLAIQKPMEALTGSKSWLADAILGDPDKKGTAQDPVTKKQLKNLTEDAQRAREIQILEKAQIIEQSAATKEVKEAQLKALEEYYKSKPLLPALTNPIAPGNNYEKVLEAEAIRLDKEGKPEQAKKRRDLILKNQNERLGLVKKSLPNAKPAGGPGTPAAAGPGSVPNAPSSPAGPGSAPSKATPTPSTVAPTAPTTGGGGFVIPVPGPLTSGFGARNTGIPGASTDHKGQDIGAATGTPVKAAMSGKVFFAGESGKYGNLITLDHDAHGELSTRYAHLSSINVQQGQTVKAGDIIGAVGATGNVRGAHLHFEIRKHGQAIDPAPYMKSPGGEEAKQLTASLPAGNAMPSTTPTTQTGGGALAAQAPGQEGGAPSTTATTGTAPMSFGAASAAVATAGGAPQPGSYAAGVAGSESGGDYNIVNGAKPGENRFGDLSTKTIAEVLEIQKGLGDTNAIGKYQFVRTTLADTAAKAHMNIFHTKFTPEVQEQLFKTLSHGNAMYLQSKGLPTTPGALYMAHFLGAGGAEAVLTRAHTDMSVADALRAGVPKKAEKIIANHPQLASKKAKAFEALLGSKFTPGTSTSDSAGGGGVVPPGPGDPGRGGAPGGTAMDVAKKSAEGANEAVGNIGSFFKGMPGFVATAAEGAKALLGDIDVGAAMALISAEAKMFTEMPDTKEMFKSMGEKMQEAKKAAEGNPALKAIADITGAMGGMAGANMEGFQSSLAAWGAGMSPVDMAGGTSLSGGSNNRMTNTFSQMNDALRALANREDPTKNAQHGPENDRLTAQYLLKFNNK